MNDDTLFERAFDLMWSTIREHAHEAAKIAVMQSLAGTKVHGDDCHGCALSGSRGVFGGDVLQAPVLVIVAVGQHTVAKLAKALEEIDSGR